MLYAPIAIFCYNRPHHLKKTIESLLRCPETPESDIFIFQDGAKNQLKSELKNFNEVHDYIQNLNIGKNKVVNTSTVNKGLANSIRFGIDTVLNSNDNIIVLEDDLELSPGFLKYMNDALNTYNSNEEVMHISGYVFPIDTPGTTFFMNYTSCWGWATWKRSWCKLEWDCLYIYKNLIQKKKWGHFTLGESNDNAAQLLSNIHGKIETWAVRWQSTIELNNGFCLHPGKSLVRNIGFDGSGENCKANHNKYDHIELANEIQLSNIAIIESEESLNNLKEFYQSGKPDLIQKIKSNKAVNKLLDQSPRKILKQLKKSLSEDYDSSALESSNRFEPFEITAREFKIVACDNASFASMWDEIFVKNIYMFKPKKDNPTIVDIGANIGLSALFFSSHYNSANITAYEADPDIFQYLIRNIEANGVQNIKAFNKAVWKETGNLSFTNNGADAGFISRDENVNSISVPAISFQQLIDNHSERIDLLKMDIEGAEVETILSYPAGLKKIDHLFIEYHSFVNEMQELDLLLSAISNAGFRYKIYNVYDQMPESPFLNQGKYGNMDLQVNIFGYRD